MNIFYIIKPIILLYIFFHSFTVKGQKLLYSSEVPVEEVRISPKHASGGLVRDKISNLHYIPISSVKKEDIINFINKMCITDSTLAVLSNANNKFQLINTSGKITKTFLASDFKIPHSEPIQNMISEDGGFTLSLIHYVVKINNQGQYNVIELPKETQQSDNSIKINKTIWSYFSPDNVIERKSLTAIQMNDTPVIAYKDFNPLSYSNNLDRNLSQVDSKTKKCFAFFTNNYELFELDEHGLQKVYKFIFPKDISVDTAKLYSLKDKDEADRFMEESKDKLLGFNQVLPYKDYLLLQLKSYAGDHTWIAINKTNKEVLNIKNILPDSTNDYLPIMGWNDILLTDGEYLYSVLYPNEVSAARNKSEEEKHQMKRENANLIKSNNPILVKFKLKVF
ncbi:MULTISPECIES: hypothetical protein [unclassified Sphingobacterium]|uniref:hypothetical protein n=1 Tax=unclassified Sphingobacterium TaxID=2609468 RepID=UPI001046F9AF|nr:MULTISPECIES: hypothetical protein [unclassified Sphingobacterium]MCS3556214.1 hypothetical protein [Sphingobacterium sp. JUb21]